jgi:hypothetical protein
MKSEGEIKDMLDKLKTLRSKESLTVPRKHGRGRRWSTFGITRIRRLEGRIKALQWVLGDDVNDEQEEW